MQYLEAFHNRAFCFLAADTGVRSEITVIVGWMTEVKRKLGGTP
jgi:hypothetical protein